MEYESPVDRLDEDRSFQSQAMDYAIERGRASDQEMYESWGQDNA